MIDVKNLIQRNEFTECKTSPINWQGMLTGNNAKVYMNLIFCAHDLTFIYSLHRKSGQFWFRQLSHKLALSSDNVNCKRRNIQIIGWVRSVWNSTFRVYDMVCWWGKLTSICYVKLWLDREEELCMMSWLLLCSWTYFTFTGKGKREKLLLSWCTQTGEGSGEQSGQLARWAARGEPAFSRELLAKPDFRSDDRLYRDLREGCLMSAQLEEGLKADGPIIRTGRDPSPYFRDMSREGEMFLLPQQFLKSDHSLDLRFIFFSA